MAELESNLESSGYGQSQVASVSERTVVVHRPDDDGVEATLVESTSPDGYATSVVVYENGDLR